MIEKHACVAVSPTCQTVGQLIDELQKADIDLRLVSIVGQGYQGKEHPVGFYSAKNRILYHGHQDVFWNDLWERLTGAAFFWIPEFGPLAAAGPIVDLLVRGLEEVEIAGGFDLLGKALFNLGASRDCITDYQETISAKQFLLIVSGKRNATERACTVLHDWTQQVTFHRA